jgi:signal transduction histidine kinase
MSARPSSRWLIAAWVIVLGSYAVVSHLLGRGAHLAVFADTVQCLIPLLANAALLINAVSPNWRRTVFWMLLALGSTLWMVGQFGWTYYEVYLRAPLPTPFAGDIIIFLHTVPLIAALGVHPYAKRIDPPLRFGTVDFSLLLLWWVYLYVFTVIPWQYVTLNPGRYSANHNILYLAQNLVLIVGFASLVWRTEGNWRRIYAHLLGASATYAVFSLLANRAIERGTYYSGSVYDLPLLISFLWYATAGILAYRWQAQEPEPEAPEPNALENYRQYNSPRAAWLAMAAVLSLPVLAIWSLYWSSAPDAVREFRLVVTLIAILPFTFLVFLRQTLVDRDHLRLLGTSQASLENLRRLQSQFAQAERLASLGQLAAGAAHEINNPLTAILGFSDLLADDPSVGEKAQGIGQKIRDQARRTGTLVSSLLSFARQSPSAQRSLLDLNAVLSRAVQLRRLDLRGKNIQIDLQVEPALPGVLGDPNQLLQVFYNIITNAVDSMEVAGGGTLTIHLKRTPSTVIIDFSDTGPGIRQPQLVFDPFYSTKPVGKGTGLGLSICYGLVREHGGHISCFNRPEGGATFRIELPAVPPPFPLRAVPLPTGSAAPDENSKNE